MNKQNKMGNEGFVYSDAIPVSYMPIKAGTYSAELFGSIDSPSQFANIISAMSLMTELDTFELQLQSNGGCVDAGDALLMAIDKCEGHVHIAASGGCHSMATAILLKAHSFELSEGFQALIHAGGTGFSSDFSEFKQYTEFNIKFHEKFIRRTYDSFLTEAEIEDVLNGKPIVLDAEGWVDRVGKRNDIARERIEALKNKQATPAKKPAKRTKKISKEEFLAL